MITGAIGFAALENVLFVWSAIENPTGQFAFLLTGNFRFMGATLVHIVSSAFVGGLIGLAFYGKAASKLFHLICGLLGAIILHATFNYFIISTEPTNIFRIFSVLWIAAILIILFFEKVKYTFATYPKRRS